MNDVLHAMRNTLPIVSENTLPMSITMPTPPNPTKHISDKASKLNE